MSAGLPTTRTLEKWRDEALQTTREPHAGAKAKTHANRIITVVDALLAEDSDFYKWGDSLKKNYFFTYHETLVPLEEAEKLQADLLKTHYVEPLKGEATPQRKWRGTE